MIPNLPNLKILELYSDRVISKFTLNDMPKSITRLALNLHDHSISKLLPPRKGILSRIWNSIGNPQEIDTNPKTITVDFQDIMNALPNLLSLSLFTSIANLRFGKLYRLTNVEALPLVELDIRWRPLNCDGGMSQFPITLKKLTYSMTHYSISSLTEHSHTLNLSLLTALEYLDVDVLRINLCADAIPESLRTLKIFCMDSVRPVEWCFNHGPLFPSQLTYLKIDYYLRDLAMIPQNVMDDLPTSLITLKLPYISSDSLISLQKLSQLQVLRCYNLKWEDGSSPNDLQHLPRSLTKVSNCFGISSIFKEYLPFACKVSSKTYIR